MNKDLHLSLFPLVFCMILIFSCNQNKPNNDVIKQAFEDPLSPIEYMYQLASEKNQLCLIMADSILHSTSDPNTRAEAFYIKGLYYSNIQDKMRSEQLFDSTIQENFTYFDAYIEKGILLNQRGAYEEALETLKIAIKLTKNNPDLYYWIGKSYEGLKKMDEARSYYELTLKTDPSFEAAKEAIKRTKQ